MTSPILWQNPDQTITLIDVPHSIVAAQGIQNACSHLQILSTPPLLSPYPSNEPKSAVAKLNLESISAGTALHAEYQNLLHHAVDTVGRHHEGGWCLPRLFTQGPSPSTKKRKSNGEPTGVFAKFDTDSLSRSTDQGALPDGILSSIARRKAGDTALHNIRLPLKPDPSYEQTGKGDDFEGVVLGNESDLITTLKITPSDTSKAFLFRIPPSARFYLGDCAQSKPFRDAVRKQAQHENARSTFDLLLLDPPWPNRSVKRTHKTAGSTYVTSSSLWDIRDLLLDTHLELLMADECLIAMWTTNKPAIRDLILGEDGIFACWDVDLVEEWLWLKTTAHGEPVTQLDGVWRKPYEVLLLGRKRRRDNVGTNADDDFRNVKRRVIVSVPDLHSRKPCLKQLIEPLMNDRENYRALEVFARHLVAGWWSWGDECIKFNWEGYWRQGVQ